MPPPRIASSAAALALLLLITPSLSADDEPSQPDVTETPPIDAQAPDTASDETQPDHDLEALVGGLDDAALSSELLLFADIPIVVTASRSGQPLSLSSAPTSILTANDIHYGGLTSIPEALQFVPGVSMTKSNRNLYGVGVRGLHYFWSERTLTLIDGREAEMPFTTVPDWLGFPLFTEDIERIEVVRGAGGASWGANALNGVINIITKDPADTQGVLLSSRIDHYGDSHNYARWGGTHGKLSWRFTTGYVDKESAENAVDNDDFSSDDYLQKLIIDTKGVYQVSDETKISAGIAYSGSNRSFFSGATDSRLDFVRSFARYDTAFDNDTSLFVQLTTTFFDENRTDNLHARSWSNVLDSQVSLAPMGPHSITFGASAKWNNIELVRETPALPYFEDGPLNEYVAGGFIQDRVDLGSRWTLEGQLRLDASNRTETDWAGRLALLKALDKDQHHVLRFATARAYRILGPDLREARSDGFFGANLPGTGVSNEEIWTIEAGYHGRLTSNLTFRVDAYYQRYEDLIGITNTFTPPFTFTSMPDNITGADAYGLETELALKGDHGQASIWYTYNAFELDDAALNIRANTPALHNVGLTGRLFIPGGWTANGNYRYTDIVQYPSDFGLIILPPVHRLDLSLAKSLFDDRGELMIGVEDVFNRTRSVGAFDFGTGELRAPGRAFFIRAQFKF